MADSIHIRNGSFRANVDLDELCKLPLRNYKKLVKLMRGAAYDNQDSLAQLRTHLQEQVELTKAAWQVASLDLACGWKLSARKENKRLENALKITKAAHERAVKQLTIFEL